MRGGVWMVVSAGVLAGCGGSESVAVQLELDEGCASTACRIEADGAGLLVTSADMGSDDVAPRAGERTLYAEVPLPDGRTAVVELGFDRGALSRARYREIQHSRVVFAGPATELSGRAPREDRGVPVAGRFAFEVRGEDGHRAVAGHILPASGEAVQVPAGGGVRGTTSAGCDGEVYVPPPVVDPGYEDPYRPDPPASAPDPGPPPPPSDPGPSDGWSNRPPPPPSSGGCEGDTHEPAESEPAFESSGGGCEGDGYDDGGYGSENDAAGGGCEGDGYDDDYASEDSGGGCEGDGYDADENAQGCEGDAAAAAAVLPLTPRVLGSLWRFSWPFAVCGVFNRRARRRPAPR